MTPNASSTGRTEGSLRGFRLLEEAERVRLVCDPVEVAPELIGMVLISTDTDGVVTGGRIVEVEAYRGAHDSASHAFRGRTQRNDTMFGVPGLLYVYFTYGMHYCCNVVCGAEGEAGAVLIRALEPLTGIGTMRSRRSVRRARPPLEPELCAGPGRLCQALGIDRSDDGTDLFSQESRVRLGNVMAGPPAPVATSRRIGLAGHLLTADEPWRFYEEGNRHVSASRPRPSRTSAALINEPRDGPAAESRSTRGRRPVEPPGRRS